MPKRIEESKKVINTALLQVQVICQDGYGMGVAEFTRLVLEVLDERSEAFILSNIRSGEGGDVQFLAIEKRS